MSKQLYIGNLSPEADGDMLKKLFSMFGTVDRAYIIADKETGKSKGYGFVVMKDEQAAQAAVAALNGKKCGDFTVKVEITQGKK